MTKQCSVCNTTYSDQSFCPNDGTPLTDPFIGKILKEKYLIDSLIHEVSFGNLYSGKHIETGTKIAVKILYPSIIEDFNDIEIFNEEAERATKFNHPNLIKVMDFGFTEDYCAFVVMELLDGISLEQILAPNTPLSLTRSIAITKQICAALEVAHKSGFVHTNLTPRNIMILQANTENEMVKVPSFSVCAVRTKHKFHPDLEMPMIYGVPKYRAPEKSYASTKLHIQTDIYNVGIILYEMLAGTFPFTPTANSTMDWTRKHLREIPRRLSEINSNIPIEIEMVVIKALAKILDMRQQTAEQLAKELEWALKPNYFEQLANEYAVNYIATRLTQGINFQNLISLYPEPKIYLRLISRILDILVSKGINLNTPTKCSIPPIQYAIFSGEYEIVSLLLGKGVDINSASCPGLGYGKITPLMLACRDALSDIARCLIYNGADVNFVNKHGYTAWSVTTNSQSTLKYRSHISDDNKKDINERFEEIKDILRAAGAKQHSSKYQNIPVDLDLLSEMLIKAKNDTQNINQQKTKKPTNKSSRSFSSSLKSINSIKEKPQNKPNIIKYAEEIIGRIYESLQKCFDANKNK
jgi:serine/threonine-protein kinase